LRLEFSYQKSPGQGINNASVKVLLAASADLLRLDRVGHYLVACALLAFASCMKNEPVDEAKAAGKTIADFPQITADIFKPMDGGIDLSPQKSWGAIHSCRARTKRNCSSI
jgi:hypothetical protein